MTKDDERSPLGYEDSSDATDLIQVLIVPNHCDHQVCHHRRLVPAPLIGMVK